jgi:hypothetical protein
MYSEGVDSNNSKIELFVLISIGSKYGIDNDSFTIAMLIQYLP